MPARNRAHAPPPLAARFAHLGRLAHHRDHAHEPSHAARGCMRDRKAQPFAQEYEEEGGKDLPAGEDEQHTPERQGVPELPARYLGSSGLRCHRTKITGVRTRSKT